LTPGSTGSLQAAKLVGAVAAVEKPTSVAALNVRPVGEISVNITSSDPGALPLASAKTYSRSLGKLSTKKIVSVSTAPAPLLVTVIV